MDLEVEQDPANPRKFRLTGEIDVSNYEYLVAALEPAVLEGGDLILDLAGLAFMDSQGIRALLVLSQRLEGRGTLKIVSPGPLVARVLEVVRADTFPNVEILAAGGGG